MLLARIGWLASQLDLMTVHVNDDPAGHMLMESMGRSRLKTPLHELTSVLFLPSDAATFTQGASKQTLRRMTRKAERLGVTWRAVSSPDERRALIERGDAFERSEARKPYRRAVPENQDLVNYDTWFAAFDAEGGPLMLSVTGISGDVATLRYFRTMASSDAATWSRYPMTTLVVQAAVAQGCTVLLDLANPISLQSGLRHFAKMVGFELHRVRIVAESSAPKTARPDGVRADVLVRQS